MSDEEGRRMEGEVQEDERKGDKGYGYVMRREREWKSKVYKETRERKIKETGL